MKEIQLTQGKVALIDDEDFELVNQYKWHTKKYHNFYCASTNINTGEIKSNGRIRQRPLTMHTLIMNYKKDIIHNDNNRLNNQKYNLILPEVKINISKFDKNDSLIIVSNVISNLEGKKAGVYKITNTINNKAYVGSSVNLTKRLKQHLNYLRKNIHDNIHLQRTYNIYGEGSFIFEIVRTCDQKDCIKEEQKLIDSFEKQNLYNILLVAGSNLGHKCSKETLAKMTGLFKTGHTPWNKGTKGICKSYSAKYISKKFALIDPLGKIHIGENIKKFAENNDLCYTNILSVINNKRKRHKGWTKFIENKG